VTLRPKHVILAVLACVAAALINLASTRLSPAFPGVIPQLEGAFTVNGQYPGDALVHAPHVRTWGSWSGDDANEGTFRFGPVAAPRIIRFGIGGFPRTKGIQVLLELNATGEQHAIPIESDVGEHWHLIDAEVPGDWVGKPVSLVAIDHAKVLGGWVAMTEPVRGARGDGNNALFISLAGWTLNAVLLGLLWLAALRLVAQRRWVPDPWVPLVATGLVAAAGYVAFWIFLANTIAGKAFSITLLLAAVAWLMRRPESPSVNWSDDCATAAKLLVVIAFLYVTLLHLYPSSREIYDLASNRFRESMPGDNTLPRNVAWDLMSGRTLRWPPGGWQSSDRPPLQSGWQLLTLPVSEAAKIDELTSTCMAAIWLQSIWIFAAYGLMRTLQLSKARAAGWTAALALSGFFVENTVFTWPKLSAGAFACGAFALWFMRGKPTRTEAVIGALLAGLAWLSHGGVAFAYLALLPWIAWRLWRDPWRIWIAAGLMFFVIAVPWICYQKFYDPPGNRLLKWHLGGQIEPDQRGTWETIRDGYKHRGWTKWKDTFRANLETQISGDWRSLFGTSQATAATRRHFEFFYSARALTWWCLGVLVLPLALLRRRFGGTSARAQGALLAWTLATVVVWSALMFLPREAVIHQGSYTTLLGAFVLLSVWLDAAWAWLLVVVVCLQSVTLVTTWTVPNSIVHGPPTTLALGLTAGAAVALMTFVVQAMREKNPNGGSPAMRKALPWVAGIAAMLPLVWCWNDFRDLFWFGDEWDQLDQISNAGFWRWTTGAFGENFAPVFKLTWGSVAVTGHGSYFALVIAIWLMHAACVVVLGRWLLRAGYSLAATAFVLAAVALAATNIETLGWTIQLLTVQGMLFFIAAGCWLQRDPKSAWSRTGLIVLAVLIVLSTFSFVRGVLTGTALAAAALWPFGEQSGSTLGWRRRTAIAVICLVPAALSVGLIMTFAGGNQHHLSEAGFRAPAMFAAAYFSLNPVYDFTSLGAWNEFTVLGFGALKVGLMAAGWWAASPAQRRLLLALLVFDLGNAVLLGIGRYHVGLFTATSSRYQYISLICTLPFVAAACEGVLRRLRSAPQWSGALAAVGLWATTLIVVSSWPAAMQGWAEGRGRKTREVVFHDRNAPAEGAIPGIPQLRTQRARELAAEYHLH
jgi:hypothetical protein